MDTRVATHRRLMRALHIMQKEGELCDVTLKAENMTLPAHCCILASQSDTLKRMFLQQDTNSIGGQSTLDIQGMSGDTLKVFVDFLYTGSLGGVELPIKSVEEIITAAQNLGISITESVVLEYFQRFIRCSQFRLVLDLGDRISMNGLKEFVLAFAAVNLGEFIVKGERDFCNLRLDELTNILARKEMEEVAMSVKVRAVIKWCVNEFREQIECLELLLGYIVIDQSTKSSLLLGLQALHSNNKPSSSYLNFINHFFEREISNNPESSNDPCIFIMGGENEDKTPSQDMFLFNPQKSSIVQQSHVPYNCLDHSAVLLDGKLFLAGGQSSNDSKLTDSTDNFYSYNPTSEEWNILPPMQKCRSVFALVATNGRIYAVGGKNSAGSLASAEYYDPSSNAWSYIEHTYTGLFGHAGTAYDDMVFVSGGVVAGRHFTHSLQCYKPGIDKWVHMAPMVHKRAFHGMCRVGDKLYVIGGNTSDPLGRRIDCNAVERYSPEHDRWSHLISMPRPVSLAGTAAYDGRIFVVGGYSGKKGEKFDDIQCYHVRRKQWSIVGKLPGYLMRSAVC